MKDRQQRQRYRFAKGKVSTRSLLWRLSESKKYDIHILTWNWTKWKQNALSKTQNNCRCKIKHKTKYMSYIGKYVERRMKAQEMQNVVSTKNLLSEGTIRSEFIKEQVLRYLASTLKKPAYIHSANAIYRVHLYIYNSLEQCRLPSRTRTRSVQSPPGLKPLHITLRIFSFFAAGDPGASISPRANWTR